MPFESGPYRVFFAAGKWRVVNMDVLVYDSADEQRCVRFAKHMNSKYGAGLYRITDEDRERMKQNEDYFMASAGRAKARREAAKNIRRRA